MAETKMTRFAFLVAAWRGASTDDRRKFLHCMARPLEKAIEAGLKVPEALAVLAFKPEE